MQLRPRLDAKRRKGDVTLADVVSAVMDVAQNERVVTAGIVLMLQSGSIRLRRPLDEVS